MNAARQDHKRRTRELLASSIVDKAVELEVQTGTQALISSRSCGEKLAAVWNLGEEGLGSRLCVHAYSS